jgi:MOSC domain-containing protein YiiM
MHIVSIQVGRPREIEWKGERFATSIFKQEVAGRVRVRALNLEGDAQADLSVHGGVKKAVYAYPSEHYAFWRGELPGVELPWGAFGENLTTAGMDEAEVCVGDTFRIGTAVLRVTQPRLPCYKLAAKFQNDAIIARFLHSGRSGFYLEVVEEGEAGAGDGVTRVEAAAPRVSIADLVALHTERKNDAALLRRAASAPALPDSWKSKFAERLAQFSSE